MQQKLKTFAAKIQDYVSDHSVTGPKRLDYISRRRSVRVKNVSWLIRWESVEKYNLFNAFLLNN